VISRAAQPNIRRAPLIQIRSGLSRVVLLCGDYAIKFPNIFNGDGLYVTGMLGNVLERSRWKHSKNHPALVPVLFCFPFGLFLVQPRCYALMGRELTQEEVQQLPFVNIDNKGENFGIRQGRIVVIDYGNADQYFMQP
jgi:hypothetical protein